MSSMSSLRSLYSPWIPLFPRDMIYQSGTYLTVTSPHHSFLTGIQQVLCCVRHHRGNSQLHHALVSWSIFASMHKPALSQSQAVLTMMSSRLFCFFLDVFNSITGLSSSSLRQVWLDSVSNFYCAFGKEQVLIDELPGYKSRMQVSGAHLHT